MALATAIATLVTIDGTPDTAAVCTATKEARLPSQTAQSAEILLKDDLREFLASRYVAEGITENEIEFVMERLNNRPRKCLGFKTPNQVFFNRLPVIALGS